MKRTAMSYKDVVVIKPWGKEYLIYENDDVGVWALHLNDGHKTSMHCHPNKNTGLIVLSGLIEVSFLTNKSVHYAPSKVMIRKGLFHSSRALGGDAIILEIESPKDKLDLVRFGDDYGREDKPYEGHSDEHFRSHELWIEQPKNLCGWQVHKLCGTPLIISTSPPSELLNRNPKDIVIILMGNIYYQKHIIAGPGDVITVEVLNMLTDRFKCTRVFETLIIGVNSV
ncbi:MAG: hypothetical protein KKB59_19750 [Spirochaetes bacterium]|nr:hypothetical protein [Spirochaetota bacterium]